MERTVDLINKKVVCQDLAVGEVKAIIYDPVQWKITHLEVGLSEDAAQMVFGTRKGQIRNLLAVSAVGNVGKKVDLKVKKGQLRIYLRALKPNVPKL